MLYSDINKMKQVLRNMISNALKFTPRGGHVEIYSYIMSNGEVLHLEDAMKNQQGYVNHKCCVRFEVHDSGPGISKVLDNFIPNITIIQIINIL
jgi:signal transduction histidine kinase